MTRSTSIALSPEDIDAIAQRLLTLMHEQAAPAPAATTTPKASPKATKATKAKAKAPSGPRCTAIKPNGHRCRGRGAARGVGEDGLCEFHRKAAASGSVARVDDAAAGRVVTTPKAKAAPKVPTVKRTSDPGVTCKGRTKSGGACGRWVGLDEHGYCKAHAGQRSEAPAGVVEVATVAIRPNDV